MSDKKPMDYSVLFKGLNINKGDIIDVASDVASIMMYARKNGYSFSPDGLLDALKELVGNDGTVMIRTFTWDFCQGIDYDVRTSVSRVGAFGNVAMKRPDFRRTQHPMYSWMVWGRYADELVSMTNKSAYGDGSPFDFLYKMNAKQLTIGNTVADACTQMHHAEAVAKVPYRTVKDFTGSYTDADGVTSERTYSLHVRPLDLVVKNTLTDRAERGDLLLSKGIMKKVQVTDSLYSAVILLHEITDFFIDDLNNNEGRFIVSVNGCEGYKAAGVDYSKVRY